MPYPNSFEDFVKEVLEDAFDDEDAHAVQAEEFAEKMTKLLASLKEDEGRGRAVLHHVLGLGYQTEKPTDYIEAAFRTLILDLFPGPSYIVNPDQQEARNAEVAIKAAICGKVIPDSRGRICRLAPLHEGSCGSSYED